MSSTDELPDFDSEEFREGFKNRIMALQHFALRSHGEFQHAFEKGFVSWIRRVDELIAEEKELNTEFIAWLKEYVKK